MFVVSQDRLCAVNLNEVQILRVTVLGSFVAVFNGGKSCLLGKFSNRKDAEEARDHILRSEADVYYL